MPIPRSRQTQGLNMLHNDTRRDFATDSRLLHTTAIAASVGLLSTGIAYLLLLLIRFFTNLFSSRPGPSDSGAKPPRAVRPPYAGPVTV